MSETLSQDPENLGSGYALASSYPPTAATPSSTVQDAPGSNLPPFSTFSSDMDAATGFGSDRLFTDTRLLDISSWDYYGETRLLDRTENGISVISSQPQYRPWESKPIDSTSQESLRHSFSSSTPISTFADAFAQNGVPKLPSFQSQFQTFNEPTTVTTSEPTLTTLTNLTPVSPNSSSPGGGHLTTLNSSFHTLSAVNTRNYPLVPAPIQAREIPSIQQQFLDERHIQLFTHPTTSLTALNNTIHSATIFPTQNGTILPNNQIITTPTVVTVLKSEPTHMSELKLGTNLTIQDSDLKLQNVGLHHTQFQNPMSTVLDHNGIYNGLDKKLNGINAAMDSPTRNDFRKKERRKIRASSLESSAESDGASSNMEVSSENSGQVASVSSTASFKTHHVLSGNGGMEADEISGGNVDKQVKKKRKRCGECIGCQRKDNCGDCAPCRNDKSHQICKQRRCEKLTEKKLYGDDGYIRGDSRRGRGKGRGGGSYRGRKPSGPVSLPTSSVPEPSGPPPSRPSPQPVHMLKPEQAPQQQPMTPMPFYADPNRFTTPVWQADPTQGWAQGQFIQQIPAAAQPPLEGYTQQYPNGIYQTTYQQPTGFETNTFYTGAVQVLTRPPSAPNQAQLPNRPNGSYSHTPSPVPGQTQQNNQRTNISGQYQQEYATNNQNYAAPSTTPTGNIVDSSQSGGMSRPNSVNSTVNAPSSNQNFQTQHTVNFTPISSSNFSPVSNSTTNFVNSNINTNSGNAMPGYPPVNSHPQLASHNYSGGYPGNQMGGQNNPMESPHNENNQHWSTNSNDSMWEQNVIQQACNNESAKSDQNEMQYTQNGLTHQNEEMQYNNHQNDKSNHQQQIAHLQMQNGTENQFSQADRINLNSRLKTMILTKQQQQLENKMDESQKIEQNQTGHFLWYSHHRRHYNIDDGGGVPIHHLSRPITPQKHLNVNNSAIDYQKNQNKQGLITNKFVSPNNNNTLHNKSEKILESIEQGKNLQYRYLNSSVPSYQQLSDQEFVRSIIQQQSAIKQEESHKKNSKLKSQVCAKNSQNTLKGQIKQEPSLTTFENVPKQNNVVGLEIPQCSCLPPHQFSPEPGSYYTHLGCASDLPNLRKDLENRTGVNGKALRVEKICYTGKEGKTPQGCPIAKWIIRRANYEEKYLIVVKHRPGHFCKAAIIVVCIVAWDGVLQGDADNIYNMLCSKLNKFGLPTTRRCATNESRTCACQGLDQENCGASFSFGCSWSMYYNGCKFARSKIVRKFRLSEKSEEEEVEERLQLLTTHLTPLYQVLAPDSFKNQCEFEEIASDCRLGLKAGRPFSGVTACVDFCAHAHKDSHNMNNGCTVVVTLTKHRGLSKPDDEQLHVLPLYVIDPTDEFGSKEDQENKIINGSVEVLHKYQCEVRVRDVPQPTCRRAGKKKKDDSQEKCKKDKKDSPQSLKSPQLKTPTKQLQSNHVSSTVIENSGPSPPYGYVNNLYYNPSLDQQRSQVIGQAPFNHTTFKNSVNNAKYQHISSAVNNSKVIENYTSNEMFKNNVNNSVLLQEQPNSALHSTYPYSYKNILHQNVNHMKSNVLQFNQNTTENNTPQFITKGTNKINCDSYSDYQVLNRTIQNLPLLSNPNQSPVPVENSQFSYKESIESVRTPTLPPFTQFRNFKNYSNLPCYSKEIDSPSVLIQNPFDDSLLHSPNSIKQPDFDYDNYYSNWNSSPSNNYVPVTPPHPNWYQTSPSWSPVEEKPKVLGQVTDVIDNNECFTDSQVGGVAIALSHGSVLFECAKHELHATTALKYPNRKTPTRISLVFYQHRNLNNAKHGWEEHEEKMRLKKLDMIAKGSDLDKLEFKDHIPYNLSEDDLVTREMMNRVPTMTTASVTTKFPMYPCMVTGPYQEGIKCA